MRYVLLCVNEGSFTAARLLYVVLLVEIDLDVSYLLNRKSLFGGNVGFGSCGAPELESKVCFNQTAEL